MCGGFGLLIGIVAVGALAKLAVCGFRRRRGYASCGGGGYGGGCESGWHGGWHRGPRDGYGGYGRRGWFRDAPGEGGRAGDREGGFSFGKRLFLRWLFERLDTTPGQEKVIAEAFDEIRAAMKDARGEWSSSRTRMADALRGAEFDHEAVGDAWAKHDSAFEAVRLEVVTAMQRVHEALDERQRKILADLVERGGLFGRWERDPRFE